MPWFSAITGGLGEQNPYDEIANWSNEAQRRNRQAVGLDANGNPLPTGLDANGNPVAPAAADPNNPVNNGQSAATGTALASGVQQPGQQPNSTKTDPSLGALLMNLTQYQQREQGFNQGMGGAFAAFSQPRDRDWVKAIFNVNEPDPMKIGQQEQDLASQQQGQDRANSIGMIANDPARLTAIAKSLNMDPIALQTLIRSNPAAAGELIKQANIPTATASNASWIGNFGRNNGWSAAGHQQRSASDHDRHDVGTGDRDANRGDRLAEEPSQRAAALGSQRQGLVRPLPGGARRHQQGPHGRADRQATDRAAL